MNTVSIMIRCDANNLNGYGHLSRCLNIARGIREDHKKCDINFIGDYSLNAISLIEKYNFSHTIFKLHNIYSALNLLPLLIDCNYFILDSYNITQNYVDELGNSTFKFCVIADDSSTFNFSGVDLVINYAINGQEFDYQSRKQVLGLKYFPFKPEFKEIRKNNLIKRSREINHILLMIGGHDVYSVGDSILKTIDNLVSGKKITYISSSSSSERYVSKKNEVIISPFCENIETIYSEVDISVTGGGLSKYESCYCCIINASIPQNNNEYKDCLYFESSGLTNIIGTAYDFNLATVNSNISNFIFSKREAPSTLFYTESLNNLVNEILN